MTAVNPLIFREYDIRGIAEQDLTDEKVNLLGLGFGTYYRRHKTDTVVIGHDVRLSSPRISEALQKGLTGTGCNIIDIGMVPTPVLYFSMYHLNCDNAIMITASHNPKEFNGFKVCAKKSSIFGEEIQGLRKLVEAGEFSKGDGKIERKNIVPEYIKYITGKVNIKKGLRAIFDTGNGTCGPMMDEIMGKVGIEHDILFKEPDGSFPNHLPDPTVEKYIKDLIEGVKAGRYDAGIGIDGDGDRIGVIDERGDIIWGDVLLAIYAEQVLKRSPGAKIVFEVKCSKGLVERIAQLGGTPVMYRTGHSLIKAKMKLEHSPLAGEMSGHIFFADRYFGYDDAIYASLRLLEILGNGVGLSDLAKRVPRYFSTPEIRIDVPDEKKFGIVKELTGAFKKDYPVLDIDGARVDFGDGWGLVRASNTQPVLVLRFEAKTASRLNEIKDIFFEKLKGLT
ncbi:MAG TPA: phosphomannomutase/phosphoglucomutase [bacterium]